MLKQSQYGSQNLGSFYAAGIFRFNYKKAGYPDVIKIARQWAKDPNFYQLIVRNIPDSSFGIQFIYISKFSSRDIISEYTEQLQKKDLLISVDYQSSKEESSDTNRFEDNIIMLKSYIK